MMSDVAARRARLEELLRRVQANRARLGHPAVVRSAPPPVEEEEPPTAELPERPAAAESPARPVEVSPQAAAAVAAVWEGEDEDIEMEIVGEASSEEALVGTSGAVEVEPSPPPSSSPSAPSVPVSAAAEPGVEAPPCSLRVECPPPLDRSPLVVTGAVTAAPPRTIGALLRAAVKPFGTS